MKCKWCNSCLTGRRTKFCSNKCKNNFFVTRRRKELKLKAIEYLGGKCKVCGYKKCVAALTFHHLRDKQFGIAARGYTRSWESVRHELDKCILLCANCHAETHSSVI